MPIQVFGGNPTQTAYPSYALLDITAHSLTLMWPDANVNVPYQNPITEIYYNALAALVNVTTVSPNVHTITLPDATKTSVGKSFVMNNVGAASFNLLKNGGATLRTIPVGKAFQVFLTDTTTAAGQWTVVDLGSFVSQADANALAGYGLTAIDTKLNTNVPIVSSAAPLALDDTYRASLIIWTGGSNTQPLPATGDVPAGYYVCFNNEGSGQLTITPGDGPALIDGKTSIQVGVGQSLSLNWDGANWFTFGFGQNQYSVTTALSKDVAGDLNVTLTTLEASSFVQNYSGLLTGNIKVYFPTVPNYWVIRNSTTGDFTLSVQTVGNIGSAILIPRSAYVLIFSDGTSLHIMPTILYSATGSESLIVNNDASVSLATPLAVASGGTGASTNAAAAIAIFPGPATLGDISFFDGTDWSLLDAGAPGQVLTMGGGGVPVWA